MSLLTWSPGKKMKLTRPLIALIGFLFVFALIASPAYMHGESLVQPNNDNSPPVAGDDFYDVHGPTVLSTLLANDHDPDNDPLHTSIETFPQHGTITGVANGYLYTSTFGYIGTDSFVYRVCDPSEACATATVSLNVQNQSPVANADTYNVHGSAILLPSFLNNDTDPDGDPVTLGDNFHSTFVSFPTHGNIVGVGIGYLYTPNYGFIGTDSFTYNVCDNLGKCAVGTVTLNINNNAPVSIFKFFRVQTGTVISGLLVNNFDPDGDTITCGDNFHSCLETFPQYGSLVNNGQGWLYNPTNHNFIGSDTFTYNVCDQYGACTTGFVFLFRVGGGENDGKAPCKSVGMPINVTNGNMYLQQTDYYLPSTGPAIEVTRTFNSNSQDTGLFGKGWSTDYDESIVSYDNALVRLNEGDGRATYFGRAVGSSDAFVPLTGDFHGQLAQNGGGLRSL
jgi:Bacterial Ig domain/Domain of unknown function (DUF6531)